MNALRDKVALVTGSSRGIGAAIAKLFAANGAKVAVHGRDEAALSAVRAEEIPVSAAAATGEERERLWAAMAEVWPGYDDYRAKTSREIPVVVLTRR